MGMNYLDDQGNLLYSNETTIPVFRTLVEFRTFPPKNNATWAKGEAIAVLLGNAAAFDQSIKLYAWDATNTTAHNGTSIVQPNAIATDATLNPTGAGRWRAV